jgi:hypothetical protein
MTSVKRDADHEYTDPNGNTHIKPRYNILTYTWGRFRQECGPALPIKETPWAIPSINPKYFTVDAFQRLVSWILASNDIEWAWIDVACINQVADSPENAEEVGHQAAIFVKAAAVFVWLWTLDTRTLENSYRDMNMHALRLGEHIANNPRILSMEAYETMVGLRTALGSFFQDPWFSSLWTLQELVLRKDAKIVSKDVETIVWGDDWAGHLLMVVNMCQNIWKDLQIMENRDVRPLHTNFFAPKTKIDVEVTAVKAMLLSAGFYYLWSDNPNVQYGTAKFRTATRDEDRIYAIMQMYNLRVGKSARPQLAPDLHPSLVELEMEFAAVINEKYPILAQLFIHTVDDVPERTWCITVESTVPEGLRTYRNPKPECCITLTGSTVLKVYGKCCSLSTLHGFIESLEKPFPGYKPCQIFLDQYVHRALAYSIIDSWRASADNTWLMPKLFDKYGFDDLTVVWLGHIDEISGSLQVGLVVGNAHPTEAVGGLGTICYRYGVYTWRVSTSDMVNWQERELLIG